MRLSFHLAIYFRVFLVKEFIFLVKSLPVTNVNSKYFSEIDGVVQVETNVSSI